MEIAAEIERSLEASSLFMAAELLERKPEQFGYLRIHALHIDRLRAVASRMSEDLEESRLRRSIEDPGREFGDLVLVSDGPCDVAPRALGSSHQEPSDYSLITRYLELDKCLAR